MKHLGLIFLQIDAPFSWFVYFILSTDFILHQDTFLINKWYLQTTKVGRSNPLLRRSRPRAICIWDWGFSWGMKPGDREDPQPGIRTNRALLWSAMIIRQWSRRIRAPSPLWQEALRINIGTIRAPRASVLWCPCPCPDKVIVARALSAEDTVLQVTVISAITEIRLKRRFQS